MSKIRVKIGENGTGADIHLYPGENLYTGEKPFVEEFGQTNSLESDLLNLASGIFATDLSVPRNEREHYVRTIEITVEVVNLHAFLRIKDLLVQALFTISRDNWTINFVQKKGEPVSNFDWGNKDGAVLLFSGGIDSMCAASEFIKEKKDLVLVSHNSHANTAVDGCQRNVHDALEKHYKTKVRQVHLKVYGRKKGSYDFPEDRENTQRTRSFLFLSLAALVTRKCGFNKVLFMAENGQFAIHLPLNQARISAFSTHTADPHFLILAQDIFRTLLSNDDFEVFNPFLYKTKAEVFALLPKQLKEKAIYSASCWMISRIPENKHCGICIPCISRRISIEFNKIKFDEYAQDLFSKDLNSLNDDDTGKRNLVDYLEFIIKFKEVNDYNRNDLLFEFPELFNEGFDTNEALELYARMSAQSFKVFEKYPNVQKMIG